ncbi:MAG: [LysW]-aminoadipate kinase [Trueperaceae bacterium]
MITVKLGGASGIDPGPLVRDVASWTRSGRPLVIVHGGSDATDALSLALGRPPRFVTGPTGRVSRVTDADALADFTMACALRNAELVTALQAAGVDAVGLRGVDGGVLRARRKRAIRYVEDGKTKLLRNDRSGAVTGVDERLLRLLLNDGRVPVLSPPALADDGTAVNVDADRAAAAVAIALRSETLILLTNVPGLLRDPHDHASLLTTVDLSDPAQVAVADAAATGRMHAKLDAAKTAVDGGVARAIVGDARRDAPLTTALATDRATDRATAASGSGTVIRRTLPEEAS